MEPPIRSLDSPSESRLDPHFSNVFSENTSLFANLDAESIRGSLSSGQEAPTEIALPIGSYLWKLQEKPTVSVIPIEFVSRKTELQSKSDQFRWDGDWDEFSKAATNLIAKYSKDGLISKEQLVNIISEEPLTGRSAAVTAMLYKNFDKLLILSGIDPLSSASEDLKLSGSAAENISKTFKDLARLDCDPSSIVATASNLFERLGRDPSRIILKSDIQKLLNLPGSSNTERQNLSSVLSHFDELARKKGSRLNLQDILDYASDLKNKYPVFTIQTFNAIYDGLSRWSVGTPVDDTLYKKDFPSWLSITPEAVIQGQTGDCYVEAVVAAIAHTHSDQIYRDMLANNVEGKTRVSLPQLQSAPILVSAPSEIEQRLFNQPSGNGYWVSALEKGYGKYMSEILGVRDRLPQELIGDGGDEGHVMRIMTGKEARKITIHELLDSDPKRPVELIKQELAEALTEALDPCRVRKAVVASITMVQPGGDRYLTKDGFTKAHAYTVLNYDPVDGGWVTVRNPHGQGHGTKEGTIKISLDQFMDNFSAVTLEGDGSERTLNSNKPWENDSRTIDERIHELMAAADRILKRFGTDNSISPVELRNLITQGTLKGDELWAASSMYKNFSLIASGGGTWLDRKLSLSSARLTESDLKSVKERLLQERKQSDEMLEINIYYNNYIERYGKNKSISKSDIQRAYQFELFNDASHKRLFTLKTLWNHFDKIADFANKVRDPQGESISLQADDFKRYCAAKESYLMSSWIYAPL